MRVEVRALQHWYDPRGRAPAGPDMIGKTLSHYTISARLGAGGMGVVYRAIDARLNRAVALKVLASDAGRGSRSQAALRHRSPRRLRAQPPEHRHHSRDRRGRRRRLPGHGARRGQAAVGTDSRDGLPVDRAIDYAMQIAAALGAAHAAGIVHRDIKPANIMAADSGPIKVLDFGVSKLLDRAADPDAPTAVATDATDTGVILGTLRYMSPEQAQGQPIDTRSDIFSFGAVLYEMLAGRAAFAGPERRVDARRDSRQTPVPVDTVRRDVPRISRSSSTRAWPRIASARPRRQEVVRRLTAIRDRRSASPAASRRALCGGPAVLVPLIARAPRRCHRRRLVVEDQRARTMGAHGRLAGDSAARQHRRPRRGLPTRDAKRSPCCQTIRNSSSSGSMSRSWRRSTPCRRAPTSRSRATSRTTASGFRWAARRSRTSACRSGKCACASRRTASRPSRRRSAD